MAVADIAEKLAIKTEAPDYGEGTEAAPQTGDPVKLEERILVSATRQGHHGRDNNGRSAHDRRREKAQGSTETIINGKMSLIK